MTEPRRWAEAAVRMSTLLIPAGPVRQRYSDELTAELWGMSAFGQLVHAASTLAGAPALHSALLDYGELAFPHSPLWCRFHLHHDWHVETTDDGGRYRRCLACGLDDDETTRRRVPGSMLNAHGVVQY